MIPVWIIGVTIGTIAGIYFYKEFEDKLTAVGIGALVALLAALFTMLGEIFIMAVLAGEVPLWWLF